MPSAKTPARAGKNQAHAANKAPPYSGTCPNGRILARAKIAHPRAEEIQLTNLTLRHLLLELRPLLENAFINRVQEVEREIYKFKMRTRVGSKDFIICPQSIYFTNYKIPAKQNAAGFGAFLNKHLKNKKILSVEQHESDRLVVLKFSHGNSLVVEFLADFNIVLLDGKGIIMQPLHRREWKDRKVLKGEAYKFPPARGLDPAKVSAEELQKIFAQGSADAVRTLVKNINIAPLFAEEALHLAGIGKQTPAKNLTRAEISQLHAHITRLYSAHEPPNKNTVLFQNTLLPFGLQSIPSGARELGTLNDAIDEIFSSSHLAQESTEEAAVEDSGRKKVGHYLSQQREAKAMLESREAENKRAGELIYSHFTELQELVNAISSAEKKKIPEKEIMYKIRSEAAKGNKAAKLLLSYDSKRKELVAELP
ncbi:MAG: NFACT family protein [Candidatus Diapherotrites archaeon]